ncbi:ATP/GTP-binding protein [Streptomyces sp. NPDC017940]|uniref:ATP/GTP-binding protein n=1 Tax=Streptomyces sp. NPDC017940 TaxID=3365017 RepID=UPI0037B719D7
MTDGRTAWEGTRDRWTRVEPALTRGLLLFAFVLSLVAQFVTPVGDALEGKVYLGGALFTLVGYVLYGAVQDLKSSLHPAARHEVQAGDLGQYFTEVLTSDPRIDAVGFTGETVVEQLKLCLERRDLRGHPQVRLRVIVPDFGRPMEVPGRVVDGRAEDDPDWRRELDEKVRRNAAAMHALSGRLCAGRKGKLHAEFRVLHISPFLKFCMIGREQLFDGIYDHVVQGPASEPPEREVLDLMGYDALLTHWHIDSGAVAREKIRQRGVLFDTLWRVARPLTPPAS